MISNRMGPHLGWMECPQHNFQGGGGEISKWQCMILKLGSFLKGFQNHKLNFEIISKWSFSSMQLPSNGHSFFVSALICTPFEALDS